jgi:hypothetical protein
MEEVMETPIQREKDENADDELLQRMKNVLNSICWGLD